MGQLDASGIGIAVAALAAVVLAATAAGRAAWRAWTRRRRAALRQAGLQFAFDACAPEGGDLSLEPFRLGRLLSEGADDFIRRR
jgi:hypothetical protein